MPTSPFDINKFLSGQPVVTQNGKQIGRLKELRFNESEELFLTAMVDDLPRIWSMDGIYLSGPQTGLNLLMTDPIIYKWAVIETMVDEDPEDGKTYLKVIIP